MMLSLHHLSGSSQMLCDRGYHPHATDGEADTHMHVDKGITARKIQNSGLIHDHSAFETLAL